MSPLDPGFNAAVLAIAKRLWPSGYDVSETAPDTYEKLAAHLDAGKRLVIYSGGSQTTIYGDRDINYAFRSWHDWCHWQGRHNLTQEGEIGSCGIQCRHIVELYGDTPETRRWVAIIQAEIIGQGTYYLYHKRFPDDQRAFIEAYMADPTEALLWPLW
jgi:hypothetical protein